MKKKSTTKYALLVCAVAKTTGTENCHNSKKKTALLSLNDQAATQGVIHQTEM